MDSIVIPSSPADRVAIKVMLGEMTTLMANMELDRGSKKDICDRIHSEYGLPKKAINKLAKTLYDNNYGDVQAEMADFEALYEILCGNSANKFNDPELESVPKLKTVNVSEAE